MAMIARNEEANLPRTLESLRWVDEIVIVDSGSVDKTPQIAVSFGAKHTFNREFRGHSEQKNIAIGRCVCDWILLLDADEVVSPGLALEIQQTLENPRFEAYWIPRVNLFLDRWMRHGGLYPDRKLRLFKRGRAMVEEGAGPHGTPQYAGTKGLLINHLQHYAYPALDLYLDHMNSYSSEITEAMLREKRTSVELLCKAFTYPLAAFVKNYFFRAGFLDGAAGLVFHWNHSVYVHWKYAKAWEALKSQPHPGR